MEFTYHAYRGLLSLLRQNGYEISGYHDWRSKSSPVILRHDVDQSLEAAVRLAELECGEGVRATYFLLLRTDFYNIASARSQALIRQIQRCGGEIGLHFDETAYGEEDVVSAILCEKEIMEKLLGIPVTAVSMHRPSQKTLHSDYHIPNMVNTYGSLFFGGGGDGF